MQLALLGLVLAAISIQIEVTTLDDRALRGELVTLSTDSLVLRVGNEDLTLPVDQLLAVDTSASSGAKTPIPTTWIQLVDGSLIAAQQYSVKDAKAAISPPAGDPIILPIRQVRSVRFLKQDDQVRSLWQEVLDDSPKGDAVVVRKGGNGKPVVLDYLEGVIQDVNAKTVHFQFEGDEIPVNRERVKVEGLLYYRPDRAADKPVCRIEVVGGGRWSVTSMQLADGQVTLTTPGDISTTIPLDQVKRWDFSLGKIVYFSDLTPLKQQWQPFLAASRTAESAQRLFGVRRDSNFDGKPLLLGDETFRKGLALHSRSELVFRLPDEFSRLVAVAGIDPSQRRHGHVRLEIRGDDRVLYDKEIDGEDAPQTIQLDVRGVGRLTVLVDYGQGLDIGDQLILGNARLIR